MSIQTLERDKAAVERLPRSAKTGEARIPDPAFVPWPIDGMDRTEVSAWGKAVHAETQKFTGEDRRKSWWAFWSTMLVLNSAAAVATLPMLDWPLRLAASVLMGLTIVRLSVLSHDYFHGAILKGSRFVDVFFKFYSIVFMFPWTLWKQAHNGYHHGRTGQYVGAEKSKHALLYAHTDIGAFPVLSTHEYARAGFWKRLSYRMARSPLMIVLGIFSIFAFSVSTVALFSQPRHRWWAALALALNVALMTTLFIFAPDFLLFAIGIPSIVASWLSVYMFYCQHNYPGMRYFNANDWDHMATSVYSSSYMRTGRVMEWFTANLGYHHVHHANAAIPFYRLPEAMQAIEAFRQPITTSLWPWDMYRCLRLKLWDPDRMRMVSFAEFRRHQRVPGASPDNAAAA